MKKTICLLLALSMAAAVFTGCGSAADSFLPEGPHAPPDLALSDGEDSHEISPSGYSWSWSNSDGSRGSIIADAIHPLDNSILRFEPLSVPAGGAKYTLTFDQTPETLSFERFDIGDVGDTEAEPSEREDQIGKAVVLRGDSVYVFNASFEQGSARYYLITKQISTGDDALDYLMSEEYGNWWSSRQKAEEASRRYKDEMYAWYARALPALLPGGEDNAVCSPLNVYLALAMLAELSGGQTQAELLDALNAQDVEALRARYAALYAANENDTPTIKSLLANSVWLRDDYTYNEPVFEVLREKYHADVNAGQMGSASFDKELRDWTNAATKDLLKEYADSMHMEPDTILELVSAIYFKAAWLDPFNATATDDGVFHGAKKDQPCRMMHRSSTARYYQGDGFCAVSLILSDSGAMYFFLPDEDADISNIIAGRDMLSLLKDRNEYENSRYAVVNMSIPQFRINAKTDLDRALDALGIVEVRSPDKADFSPLTADAGIFLSKAEHAAAVSIDEEGVTGAAYTAIGLAGAAMPPEEQIDFVLDRPFVFAVTASDGSVLFAGIVNNVD